jgi:hypothetical protein
MKGSCLCGGVSYEITPPFKIFQYCHCSRCRKFTGSAHSANLFVPPEQFNWLSGQELIGRFEPEGSKFFATCFCKRCGSSLPWPVKGGKNVVVPAGTLEDDPGIRPQHSVFWDSKPVWFVETFALDKHGELPPRK